MIEKQISYNEPDDARYKTDRGREVLYELQDLSIYGDKFKAHDKIKVERQEAYNDRYNVKIQKPKQKPRLIIYLVAAKKINKALAPSDNRVYGNAEHSFKAHELLRINVKIA
jgi:hypothetical protein